MFAAEKSVSLYSIGLTPLISKPLETYQSIFGGDHPSKSRVRRTKNDLNRSPSMSTYDRHFFLSYK